MATLNVEQKAAFDAIKPERGQRQNMTPEERAERQGRKEAFVNSLNDEQKDQRKANRPNRPRQSR